jgi:hypothetical protein
MEFVCEKNFSWMNTWELNLEEFGWISYLGFETRSVGIALADDL